MEYPEDDLDRLIYIQRGPPLEPSRLQIDAALDAWFSGEDWRSTLADYLDKVRSEMRDALIAAREAGYGR